MNAQEHLDAASARIAQAVRDEAARLFAATGLVLTRASAAAVSNEFRTEDGGVVSLGLDLDLVVECQTTVSCNRRFHADPTSRPAARP